MALAVESVDSEEDPQGVAAEAEVAVDVGVYAVVAVQVLENSAEEVGAVGVAGSVVEYEVASKVHLADLGVAAEGQ